MGHSTSSGRTNSGGASSEALNERLENRAAATRRMERDEARNRRLNQTQGPITALEAGDRAFNEAIARENTRRQRNNDNRTADQLRDLRRSDLLTIARAYGMNTRYMESSNAPAGTSEIAEDILAFRRRLRRG